MASSLLRRVACKNLGYQTTEDGKIAKRQVRASTSSSASSEDERFERQIYSRVYKRMTVSDSDTSDNEEANFDEVCYGTVLSNFVRKRRLRGPVQSKSSLKSSTSSACSESSSSFCDDVIENVIPDEAQVKLVACGTPRKLTVTILELRNLLSPRECFAYIKVSLVSDTSNEETGRTIRVHMTTSDVVLHETVAFTLTKSCTNKRLLISVWTKSHEQCTFKGCTSFGVRKFMNNSEIIQGSHYLLSESIGRKKHLAVKALSQSSRERKDAARSSSSAEDGRRSDSSGSSRKRTTENKEIYLTKETLDHDVRFGPSEDSPPSIRVITEGSEASFAGLRRRDIILSMNGHVVTHLTNFDVKSLIGNFDDQIVLKIQRLIKNRDRQAANRQTNVATTGYGTKRKLYRKQNKNIKKRRLNQHRTPITQRQRSLSNESFNFEPCLATRSFKFLQPPPDDKRVPILESNITEERFNDDVFLSEKQERSLNRFMKDEGIFQSPIPSKLQPTMGTPLCMATVTYRVNTKSARIVRRKSYCEGRRRREEILKDRSEKNSPFRRTSSLRKTDQHEINDVRTSQRFCADQPENNTNFVQFSNRLFSPKVGSSRDVFPEEKNRDFCSSSSSSSACSHSDEDNIDIVSLASSSDLAGSSDEVFCNSEAKQNEKLDARNADNVKPNQKSSCKEQDEKNGQEKTRKIFSLKSWITRKPEDPNTKDTQTHKPNLLQVLTSKAESTLFREFLLVEHSEENIDFWTESESYKNKKPHKQRRMALKIYKKFIETGSQFEVNINAKLRTKLKENLDNPNSELFVEAQEHIYKLMESDSFRRYLSHCYNSH